MNSTHGMATELPNARYLAESDAPGMSVQPSGNPCYAERRITRVMLCKELCEVCLGYSLKSRIFQDTLHITKCSLFCEFG